MTGSNVLFSWNCQLSPLMNCPTNTLVFLPFSSFPLKAAVSSLETQGESTIENVFSGHQLPKRAAWRVGAFNRSCLTFSDVHNYKAATCPEQPYAPCFTENRQGASSISWPILKWHPVKNKLSMEILSSTRNQSWCLYSVFHSPLYSQSLKCCRSSRKTPMACMTSSCHM